MVTTRKRKRVQKVEEDGESDDPLTRTTGSTSESNASSDDSFEKLSVGSSSSESEESDDDLTEEDYLSNEDEEPVIRQKTKFKPSKTKAKPKSSKPRFFLKPIPSFKITQRQVERQTSGSIFDQASDKLHVSAEPECLPCREGEFAELYGHLDEAIRDGSGACIYVSGLPGTGKTATIKGVMRLLHEQVEAGELDPFVFVEINGMRLSEPQQAYCALWSGLTGEKVSPATAEQLLSSRFNSKTLTGPPVVCMIDELDLLVTGKQKVVYNFFNWPNAVNSRLIVIAISNTMDLPERMLSNKVSSRLGLTRIPFPTYKFPQLVEIVESRLKNLKCFTSEAIEYGSRNVGAVTGDARRCLDICRRAVEVFVQSNDSGLVQLRHVHEAIKEMGSSSSVKAVQYLSFHQKLFLICCIKQSRATGIVELNYGRIEQDYVRTSELNSILALTTSELHLTCSFLGNHGIITVETAKAGDPSQKIKLEVLEQDIFTAITQDKAEKKLLSIVKKMSG